MLNSFSSFIVIQNKILFPGTTYSTLISRQSSIRAVNHAIENQNSSCAVLMQKQFQNNSSNLILKPNLISESYFSCALIAKIVSFAKQEQGDSYQLILQVTHLRYWLPLETDLIKDKELKLAIDKTIAKKIDLIELGEAIKITTYDEKNLEPIIKKLFAVAMHYYKIKGNTEKLDKLNNTQAFSLGDLLSSLTNEIFDSRIEIFNILRLDDILQQIQTVILKTKEIIEITNIDNDIEKSLKEKLQKNQINYHLQEKLKILQEKISQNNGYDYFHDVDKLKERLDKLKLNKELNDKLANEIQKLKSLSSQSSEASVLRSYLDTVLSMPWNKTSKINHDLEKTKEIINSEHYGLDEVKNRILEYLAVQTRLHNQKNKDKDANLGTNLCLIGPPGVGKTTLSKNIAKALNRTFVSVSLGGVHDEAEMRGHRRTYVGAMPGKIIKAILRAKVKNPLILLDEIDKMGVSSHNGDPASALLELLDKELSRQFTDNYLDLPFDVSQVMFITTANSYNMSSPLLDRLEIIKIDSYSHLEKMQIAKNYIIKQQLVSHGLNSKELSITDTALEEIINFYTKESGVRGLKRELEKLARKVVLQLDSANTKEPLSSIVVNPKNLESFLGAKKYQEDKPGVSKIGQITGLAWTSVGGETLQIETVAAVGVKDLKITGHLGKVMEESVNTAYSFVRYFISNLDNKFLDADKSYIHVHIPQGATPKDGPSAGTAIAICIFSALSGLKIDSSCALTGEITLRGELLAIGGLKEKILAAKRAKLKTVVIPLKNEADLRNLKAEVTEGIIIKPVNWFVEALEIFLPNFKELKFKTNNSKLFVDELVSSPTSQQNELDHL